MSISSIFITSIVYLGPEIVDVTKSISSSSESTLNSSSSKYSSVQDINYLKIFFKLALLSPLIWLAWMSAKQYGYVSRIKEDYSYKYASALAFEGYKKQAKEVDEELLKKLLEVSVDNLSQNPIRLYESKNIHGSPLNELTKSMNSFLDKQKKDNNNAKAEE